MKLDAHRNTVPPCPATTPPRPAPVMPLRLFVAAPAGLESLVAAEVSALGLQRPQVVPGGVQGEGDLATLMRCNLHSRLAHRVLVRVGEFRAAHFSELRRKTASLPWQPFAAAGAGAGASVCVRVTCRQSKIYHSDAAARCIVQAVGDALGCEATRVRADEPAALTVIARIDANQVTLSVDSSGEHLHRRGYRQRVAKAPLRETLAAACLCLASWQPTEALLDPMCGSGTMVIEAAMMALGIAPGLQRRFAFEQWPCHDKGVQAEVWRLAHAGVRARAEVELAASDRDTGAVAAAQENAARAGVAHVIRVEQRALSDARATAPTGVIVCNPPYGTRIGEGPSLRNLYARLGQMMTGAFAGWRLGLLTNAAPLAHATGLRMRATGPVLEHGGLKVRVYCAPACARSPTR